MIRIVLLVGWVTLIMSCSEPPSGVNAPNIVLFLVDDMGWQDTSVPFHSELTPLNAIYKTPSMERLAATGMKFTQAYSTAVCSPTRISLMTGMNAAKHRVTNWTLRRGGGQEPQHPFFTHNEWNVNGMSMDPSTERAVIATPLAEVLRQNGFKTIHAGKAHLGAIGTSGEDPLNLGFDINIAGHAAGAPGSYFGIDNFGRNRPDDVWAVPGLEKYHGQEIFLTEALTQEALRHLDENLDSGSPFFLYMSHYAVHTPIMADPRYVDRYLATGMDSTEAAYASMVEGMDKSLGDIMDWLDSNGQTENTIILFTSDNGGLSAVGRGGVRHSHNLPLSSGKGSAHEGGIREPMIVRWPGVTTESSENESYLIIEDFYPTILEMAGIKEYETVQEVDGLSFVEYLHGEVSGNTRPLFWHYPNFWGPSGPGIGPSSTIRKGDWKLIYYHSDQSYELFNIARDIGENENLAATELDKKQELASELGRYLMDVKAQMPYDSAEGKYVDYPGTSQ